MSVPVNSPIYCSYNYTPESYCTATDTLIYERRTSFVFSYIRSFQFAISSSNRRSNSLLAIPPAREHARARYKIKTNFPLNSRPRLRFISVWYETYVCVWLALCTCVPFQHTSFHSKRARIGSMNQKIDRQSLRKSRNNAGIAM